VSVPRRLARPSRALGSLIGSSVVDVDGRGFRESLNWAFNDPEYGLDINAADAWIQSGWNVGVYYWHQYADEDFLHDAEAKIYSNR
jgi:hypothetical protein